MSPEELDFGESNYVDDSIQTISKLKEQIETLKAALRQNQIERLLNDAGRFGIALDVGTAHRMAREQLARELPAIFGEDEQCDPET